jgi:hypothetical protein
VFAAAVLGWGRRFVGEVFCRGSIHLEEVLWDGIEDP